MLLRDIIQANVDTRERAEKILSFLNKYYQSDDYEIKYDEGMEYYILLTENVSEKTFAHLMGIAWGLREYLCGGE